MGPDQFADAFGRREAVPHSTFGQFLRNIETPEHTHTHGYRVIVVKGEMTNPFDGQIDAPVLQLGSLGSYWSVKAGQMQTTACVSETPCVFFMFSEAGFECTPVESFYSIKMGDLGNGITWALLHG